VGVQTIVPQERLVGLLDLELEADRPAVDPGAEEVGARRGISGLVIHLVRHRFCQGIAIHGFVNENERRHVAERMIFVQADAAAARARRDADEVEQFWLAGFLIDKDKRRVAARRRRWIGAAEVEAKTDVLHAGPELGSADIEDKSKRTFPGRELVMRVNR